MQKKNTHKKTHRFLSSSTRVPSAFNTNIDKKEKEKTSSFSKQETINSLLETLAKVPPTKGEDPTIIYNNSSKKIRQDINKAYFPGDDKKIKEPSSKGIVLRAIAGNGAITLIKTLCWLKTGSSAMLSEAIHSLVDTGNQAILILGLRQASGVPDKKHQYGYGRAAYFWSLISALGIFWLGAGVTVTHGIQSLLNPPEELVLSWEIWTVLGGSFFIDGYVLKKAIEEIQKTQPIEKNLFQHIKNIKDPFMMAVLLEDLSACTGVIFAGIGIGLTHLTGNPMWDSLASISIGFLLGSVAITLIRLNQRFLLGQSVDAEIERGIRELLLSRPSIDNVYAVQSQWVGPSTFSYKAEVDFDGTYLAAKLLQMYVYQNTILYFYSFSYCSIVTNLFSWIQKI
jgi:zinc transporter 9